MSDSKYIIIVGCGRVGSILASGLSGEGNSVVVIDLKPEAFSELTSEFSGFKVTGDAVEIGVLREARMDKADCVIAVTDNDNINLMVTQVAKKIFNVPITIARVYDPATEGIYKEFNIATVSPTKLSSEAFFNVIKAKSSEVF